MWQTWQKHTRQNNTVEVQPGARKFECQSTGSGAAGGRILQIAHKYLAASLRLFQKNMSAFRCMLTVYFPNIVIFHILLACIIYSQLYIISV